MIGPQYAHHDDLGCFSTPIQLAQREDAVRAFRAKPELRWPKLDVDGGPLPNGVP